MILYHHIISTNDLEVQFTGQEWESMWNNMSKCTKFLTICETALKRFTQWYYTILHLHSIYPQVPLSCFCGCPLPGFLHVFWDCEKLTSTWHEVFSLVNRLLGKQVTLTYENCLLFTNITDLPSHSVRYCLCGYATDKCLTLKDLFTGYLKDRQCHVIGIDISYTP